MNVFASQAALELARASADPASIGSPARASVMLSIYTHKANTRGIIRMLAGLYFLAELVGGNFYCDYVLLADLFIFLLFQLIQFNWVMRRHSSSY